MHIKRYSIAHPRGAKVVRNIAAWKIHGILLHCLAEEISARQPATAEQPFCFSYPSHQISFKLGAE